jgi:hypothetical protein
MFGSHLGLEYNLAAESVDPDTRDSMALIEVFAALNGIMASCMIEHWAISESVAASLHAHPFHSPHIEVLVQRPTDSGGEEGFLQKLRDRGITTNGDTVIVAGWPIHLQIARTPLETEALDTAGQLQIGATSVYVLSSAHLIALAVQRMPHNLTLIGHLVESEALDTARLTELLTRHGLLRAWDHLMGGASASLPSPTRQDALLAKHRHRLALASATPEEKVEILERLRARHAEVVALSPWRRNP